tara:strand:+ start:60868 stop:62886 length:2019 start_codon:yes stop_codon:yes gene_type:complete
MKNTLLTIGIGFLLIAQTYAQTTCATATAITAGQHTEDTLLGTDVPAPVCAQNGSGADNAEWYSYTPTNDYTINLSTDLTVNNGLDTRFHVYTGTCGSLVCHAGDDDSGSGFLSYASFTVLAGNTYYIAFDDRWSARGFGFILEEHPYVEPTTPPITFTPGSLPTTTSGAHYAVVDMNGDFLDDAVTVDEDKIQINYQNAGGGFSYAEIQHDTVEFMATWSLAAGDFDGNGYNDLLYGNGVGVTFMRANSTGTDYQEISGSEYVFSQRSNFIDLNNDGHLDAFVCHDVDPNVYYINDGNGNLQYIQGGIGDHPQGGNYGSIWTDYDNDGDQDLFIAKCRGGQSTAKINELFRNDGGGVFTDVSVQSNMRDSVQTWSSAWNDYDNDGFMDALVGASSTTDGTHKFMYNNGDGTFSDITAGSGWDAHGQYSIEHVSYDFDNDGYTDVLGGGGEIMFNNGDLTFSPVEYNISNGPIGDLNDDGFLDVRIGNTVYYNDGNDNNWLKVNVQGTQSNLNGIGARVEIYGAWGKQIRDVRSGVGFRYMNSLNAHFGIGEATVIDSIMVKWPSGVEDVIYEPDTNTTVLVVEGEHTLNIANNDLNALRIFPNPVKDVLTVEGSLLKQANLLYITDLQGKKVMNIANDANTIDVSQLPAGAYLFTVKNSEGKTTDRKFIKQ